MARAYCFASTNGDNASTMIDRRLEALKRFGCEGTIYHVNRSCKVMDCQMMEVQRQLPRPPVYRLPHFDGDRLTTEITVKHSLKRASKVLWKLWKQNREDFKMADLHTNIECLKNACKIPGHSLDKYLAAGKSNWLL